MCKGHPIKKISRSYFHFPSREGYIIGHIHGDRVMLYLGIIDILQSYRLKKKLEHGLKSVITDGVRMVINPEFL